MAATLKNNYGKITYQDDYLSTIAGLNAVECYGLVGMAQKKIADQIVDVFKNDNLRKGVKIKTDGSENVVVQLFITVKYGVTLSAVAENIIDKVKYAIEKDTGLNVSSVDIVVQGIQV